MKYIFALFDTIEEADKAVTQLHYENDVPIDQISFVYKRNNGYETLDSSDEGADVTAGAGAGSLIGGAAGIVAAIGLVGPLSVVAAGPLALALGLGAATGAVAGGLIGAFTNMGIGESKAETYQRRIEAGDVLLQIEVASKDKDRVVNTLRECGGEEIETVEEEV